MLGGAEFEYCANCGAKLGLNEWQPVSAVENDDGTLSYYAFCDDTCRDTHTHTLNAEE